MDGNVVDTPPVLRVLEDEDQTRIEALREAIARASSQTEPSRFEA